VNVKSTVKILVLLLFVATSACAIAPLTEEHTAQTLGKGKNQWAIQGGMGSSVAYKRGLNDKVDVGVMVEYQYQTLGSLIALTGKYMLIDSDNALSLIGNVGFGSGTTFGSIGLIHDVVKTPEYTLSFNGRYNVFRWDISDDDEEDAEDFLDDVIDSALDEISGTYSYVSLNMANTYYFDPNIGVTLNLGAFMFLESGAKPTPNLGLKFHFLY